MQVLKSEVRKKILDISEALFLELGYEKASMNQIAKMVGISKSNLYNYFDDKESIFHALTDFTAKKFTDLIKLFSTNAFEPKFYEIGFFDMMFGHIYSLIETDKVGLLLIVNSAVGTKYETLKFELSKTIANKFMRDYSSCFSKKSILINVIAQNLFDGIAAITKESKTDEELKASLSDFIQYHLSGFQSILKI